MNARALIFHMITSILCDKTFPWVPTFFTLWHWLWSLTYFLKTLTLQITYKQFIVSEFSYFTWIFLMMRSLCWYWNFWLDIWNIFKRKINVIHNKIIYIQAFILHISVSCDKILVLVSWYLSLWPWPPLELAIIGAFVFYKHILLIMIFNIWASEYSDLACTHRFCIYLWSNLI